jgi:uncharacterized damage-inducible protein DinB
MSEGLAEMLEYNRWANRVLLDGLWDLPPDALSARPAGISGSIGELQTHIVGGDQTFLLRTMGRQHEGELNRASSFPGLDELVRIADETGSGLIEVARTLENGANVVLPYMGKRYEFPTRFFLVHAVEHGIEHRTEVKVGLGTLGIATPNLDAWEYASAKGYGAEV